MNRIKTIIKAAVIAAAISMATQGCGTTVKTRNEYERFKTVEEYSDGAILVDKDTGIGYYRYVYGGQFAMVPIYDQDGELYRPNGWRIMHHEPKTRDHKNH